MATRAKVFLNLSLSIFLFIGAKAFAQLEPKKSSQLSLPPTLSVYTEPLEGALELGYHRYEEPGLMRQIGFHIGGDGVFTWYNNEKSFRLSAELNYVAGTLHYWGANYDTKTKISTPLETPGTESYVNARGLIGIPQATDGRTLFTPYTGLGLRYQDSRMDPSDPGAYRREITYLYGPIGIEMSSLLGKTTRFRGSIEYDLFLAGVVTSHLSDIGLYDITNKQDSGWGARTQLGVDWKMGSQTFSAKVYLQFWKIEVSDQVYIPAPLGLYLSEPANDTVTTGLLLGALF